MKETELLKILAEMNDVYLLGPDGEVEIEPQLSIILAKDGSDYQMRVSGYRVADCRKSRKVKPEKFLKHIKKIAFFKDGEFKLAGIGKSRKSYEEYLADAEFEKIDMAGLIEMFGETADRFSLTCPYNGYNENGRIFYKISAELAGIAEREIKEWAKHVAQKQLKDCDNLPPFAELYAEIEREYRDYYSKNEKFAEEHDGNVFMCDRFSEGKTKFTEPDGLWHVYNNVEFAENCARVLKKMQDSDVEKPLCSELDDEEVLKNNLREVKVGFFWHCTVSGELSKTFFFELNEDTEKWLLQFKNDYDLDNLQDLAFYNGDELLFSSCTHEGFHTRIKTQ